MKLFNILDQLYELHNRVGNIEITQLSIVDGKLRCSLSIKTTQAEANRAIVFYDEISHMSDTDFKKILGKIK